MGPSVEWPRPGWLCTPGWTSTWSKPLPPSLLVEAAVLLLVLLLPSTTSAAPAIVAEPCVHLLQQSSAAKNQARMPKKLNTLTWIQLNQETESQPQSAVKFSF